MCKFDSAHNLLILQHCCHQMSFWISCEVCSIIENFFHYFNQFCVLAQCRVYSNNRMIKRVQWNLVKLASPWLAPSPSWHFPLSPLGCQLREVPLYNQTGIAVHCWKRGHHGCLSESLWYVISLTTKTSGDAGYCLHTGKSGSFSKEFVTSVVISRWISFRILNSLYKVVILQRSGCSPPKFEKETLFQV